MPDLLADLAAIVGCGHVLTLPQDTAPTRWTTAAAIRASRWPWCCPAARQK
jgi:hypothetical protein